MSESTHNLISPIILSDDKKSELFPFYPNFGRYESGTYLCWFCANKSLPENIDSAVECMKSLKMGVITDRHDPYASNFIRKDFTACALKLNKPVSNICDDGSCQLPPQADCPGNKWFTNPTSKNLRKVYETVIR